LHVPQDASFRELFNHVKTELNQLNDLEAYRIADWSLVTKSLNFARDFQIQDPPQAMLLAIAMEPLGTDWE
jgi:maltooligosyltrehalose synthase